MDLEGSYEDIRRLVFGIESAPEFLVIDRVALGTGQRPGGAAGADTRAVDVLQGRDS